jgi:four helix bundle protein
MHILKVSGVRSYRDLVAWQKAMRLVTDVYRCTESFPKAEVYGLTAQLRRAAISVPSSIAEGQGRASTGEFKQFLGHARGSLLEVETQLQIARTGLSRTGTLHALTAAVLRGWKSPERPNCSATKKSITNFRRIASGHWPLITDHGPPVSRTNAATLPNLSASADE